jgi:ankyrin repeat protein
MVAMLRRHLNKAQLLLAKGHTDVTIRNKEGKTVLMIAVESHNRTSNEIYASKIFNVIKQIVAIDSSVVNIGHHRQTPLMRCKNVDVCRFLIGSGAKLNMRDYDKETALFYAVWSCNYEKLQCLLESGAHTNIKNADNMTILIEVTNKCYDTKYARLLLEHGAKLSSRYIEPFITVTYHASAETLQVLLHVGLDVDYKCPKCRATMLHVAVKGTHCKHGSVVMYAYRSVSQLSKIGILLAFGADTTKRDEYGYTAYDYFIGGRSHLKTWWHAMRNRGKLDVLLNSASVALDIADETTFLQQFMTQVPSASDLLQDVSSYLAY